MDNMYLLAKQQNIIVQVLNSTDNGIDGIYIKDPYMPPFIGINKAIISNTAYARCVFAEELGHHFTTVGSYVPKKLHCYADRTTINKVEYKALKWAAHYLIPEYDLLDALRDNIVEIWELAEHFNVTEEMVKFRIRLFEGKYLFCRDEYGDVKIHKIT